MTKTPEKDEIGPAVCQACGADLSHRMGGTMSCLDTDECKRRALYQQVKRERWPFEWTHGNA